MKNIEWQVSSLELSQKLERLEVNQDSAWYWNKLSLKSPKEEHPIELSIDKLDKEFWEGENSRWIVEFSISAFTVAELLEKLPSGYFLVRFGDKYAIGNYDGTEDRGFVLDPVRLGKDKNPANTCAKMLIYLKENKLI